MYRMNIYCTRIEQPHALLIEIGNKDIKMKGCSFRRHGSQKSS